MDAMKYTKAGVPTYLYYLDFEDRSNFFYNNTNGPPPGLPHAGELTYTFGGYKNPLYRQYFSMGEIQPWEDEIGKRVLNQ